MRLTLFAAALALGTAAYAQSNDPGTAAAPTDQTAPAPGGDQSMPSTPPADQSMPASPPAGQTAPGGDQSMAPTGGDQSGAPAGGMSAGATTPQPATEDYPACSATLKDKCVDRGGSHMAARHGTMHHRTVRHPVHHMVKKTTTTTTTTPQ